MKYPNTETELTIGALAERTGCTVPTIRYYEDIGLIPPAKRRSSGHRFYQAASEKLLTFVRHCRDFGFPIEQVRQLVSLSQSQERDCVEALEIARARLAAVRAKMDELRVLERSLAQFVQGCADQCAGGPAARCSILNDMNAPPQAIKGKSCCG